MPWVSVLQENGYKVYAVAPSGEWTEKIEKGGAEFVPWKLSRSGRNMFSEIGSVISLLRILRRLKPDVVQNFHTKPNIYVPIAARLAGVTISVSTVTGLGYTFVERVGLGSKIAKRLNLSMYSLANRLSDQVVFQNPDDMEFLRSKGGISETKGKLITGGSGVDLAEYRSGGRDSTGSRKIRESLGISENVFIVLFVGRLQLDKGLREFVEAARLLKRKRDDIVFVMVGAPDPGNKRSVTRSMLEQWKSEGDVVFTGRREDVSNLMSAVNTLVTPTFYREGLPRTLLEASATGLPLIGTDMPGVREAITEGVNGTLIATKDPVALADAVEELADDPVKARRYGAASLDRAINEFDHRRVIGKYLKLYEKLWVNRS